MQALGVPARGTLPLNTSRLPTLDLGADNGPLLHVGGEGLLPLSAPQAGILYIGAIN